MGPTDTFIRYPDDPHDRIWDPFNNIPFWREISTNSTNDDVNVPSDAGDVDAMMAVKAWYKIKRNWMGDPCSPKALAWDGLNCSSSLSNPPRITTLNLSSSGLNGEIATSFASLTAIQILDLSHNNLTGKIPAILAQLPSLKLLDLTNNNLDGSIPSPLLTKAQNGELTLRIESNPYLCGNGTSCEITTKKKKKKLSTPIIVIICLAPLLLLLLVVVSIIGRLRKPTREPQHKETLKRVRENRDGLLQLENRQFTYMELKSITNNFERVIGKGGFGTVYYGCLEDGTQVAVKMRSQSSSQGTKEFLAEAQHLTRVHHRNLVSMVGYCKDEPCLALVYEFMAQGTLQEHLRGRAGGGRALIWRQRLQIAVQAAQGLEYLHKGCKPPLVHRDVKTGNILLSENLEAKIADFGLSKAFQSEINNSHVSTAVMGTPGYLDPEYYATNQLSEKSDVYSFGVVLLELLTGQPPVIKAAGNAHIAHWVRQRLARGNIEDVVDGRLQGESDVNSMWKCADVALRCASPVAHQRPDMAEVVAQLKESLQLENPYDSSRTENLYTEASDVSQNSALEIERVATMCAANNTPSAR
ncbi:hypothetical protein OPV22_027998 [Ensete ventricosum]|uniref:non-specific serine/threonine protein kinase n=1 Tax=Ensete ventricosum TaxID=4639 RepID=A0AAV8PZ60_ENSVE|nr:hypothetical protein OPV22_027998 [Ensete ventricosum]